MDVAKILADLRQEREQLEEAILSLERLAMGRGPTPWPSSGMDVRSKEARASTRQQE